MSPMERKIRIRRLKRKLKAAASIGLALAAGAFVACTRPAENRTDKSPEPDGGTRDPGTQASASASAAPPDAPDAGPDAASEGGPDAAPDALAPRKDAGLAVRKDAGLVDHNEHRKGMPVRDNLLE
jgi:hypothetical protein